MSHYECESRAASTKKLFHSDGASGSTCALFSCPADAFQSYKPPVAAATPFIPPFLSAMNEYVDSLDDVLTQKKKGQRIFVPPDASVRGSSFRSYFFHPADVIISV